MALPWPCRECHASAMRYHGRAKARPWIALPVPCAALPGHGRAGAKPWGARPGPGAVMAGPGPCRGLPCQCHALSWPCRDQASVCLAVPCAAVACRGHAMVCLAWARHCHGRAVALPVVLCQCSALPWPSGGQAISAWPMPCNAMTVSGHAVFRHASAVHCHGGAAATPKVPCLWVGIIWAPLGACRWTCVQSAVGRAEAPLGPPGSGRGYKYLGPPRGLAGGLAFSVPWAVLMPLSALPCRCGSPYSFVSKSGLQY